MEFRDQLIKMDACNEAIEWVGDRTLTEAWSECPCGDWMLWGLGMMAGQPGWPSHQEVVRHTCVVVRKAVEFILGIEDNKALFSKAIEVTEQWACGMAKIESVKSALHNIEGINLGGSLAAHAATYAMVCTINTAISAVITPANDRLERANCVCGAANKVASISIFKSKKDELKAQADYLRSQIVIPEVSS